MLSDASVYPWLRAKRNELMAGMWGRHAEVCDCRSTNGARCERARLIEKADIALRKVEVLDA